MRRPILLAVGILLLVAATGQSVLPERPVTLCSVVAGFSGRLFESLIVSALPLSGSSDGVRTDVELVLAEQIPSPEEVSETPTAAVPTPELARLSLTPSTEPLGGFSAVWLNGRAIDELTSLAAKASVHRIKVHRANQLPAVASVESPTCTG
ncbi:MAG: hypothetical protein KY459_08225 [Acidobacteria bacterium]|nr:hypothetical protein [Acidobacteriota bacterium]